MSREDPMLDELFRTVPLLRALTAAQRRSLRLGLREEWFNPGEEIVGEGMPPGRLTIIGRGRAREIIRGRPRRAIGPGQLVGDVAIFDGQPSAATVRAETHVKAFSISAVALQAVLAENWDATREMIAGLCRQVRALSDPVAS